jgi:hypothetical protein
MNKARRNPRFAAGPLVGLVLVFITACSRSPETGSIKPQIERRYDNGAATLFLRLSRNQITVADQVQLVLEAHAPEGQAVQFPTFEGKLGEFTVAATETSQPHLSEGGRVVVSRTFELEPFLAGDYQIPPMTVRVGAGISIATAPETIKVLSVLPQGQKPDIKEIGPPVDLPGLSGWLYFLMGLAAAALALSLYMLWRRRKGGRKARAALPPHEFALAELRKLMAEDLIAKGQAKLFYLRVSAILRHYIEDRFGLRAPERTTEEFLNDLQTTHVLLPRQKELLKRFLEHCDMVKFAEYQPNRDEVDNTLNTCAQFIAETRQQEAPEVAPARR